MTQSKTLAERVARYSPDCVVSSREPKAMETAKILASHLDKQAVDSVIRERPGRNIAIVAHGTVITLWVAQPIQETFRWCVVCEQKPMLSQISLALRPIVSFLLVAVLLISHGAIDTRGSQNSQSPSYSVEQVIVGGATEYRFKLNNRHFGTLIDEGGTFAFRPHPGCDINGWGSTWYAQPFLPGARLKHTVIDPINANPNGIDVRAAGQVSRGASETYGAWNSVIDFTYDPVGQVITGAGQYSITLAGRLGSATGDLNLYRIASNYLDDVPLLSGGIGDTGDMKEAVVRWIPGSIWFTWIPPNRPAHFPTDKTGFLSVDVVGQFNDVDTKAQGYPPIAPAFKPSLKVTLASRRTEMMFGGIYDLSKRQLYWEDNIGITPLVSQTSPDTEFNFDVTFESVALETCTYLPLIMKP